MRLILACFLFVLLNLAYAEEKIELSLKLHQTEFQIIFPANRTTGYKWDLEKYDKSLLELAKSQYIAPKTSLMGAGGVMIYTFKLIPGKTYPASTEVVFKYGQPWEPEKSSQKKVTVNFEKNN